MTSLTDVLRGATTSGRRALTLPGDVVDPTLAARLEEAREEGRQQGLEEGRREGERNARRRLDRLAASIGEALDGAREEARQARAAQADEVVALALEAARTVLAREPSQGAADALARVERALADLDEARLTVQVARDAVDEVAEALSARTDVVVTGDPRLRSGEARVRGAHALVDLSDEAVWQAVADALAAPAPVDDEPDAQAVGSPDTADAAAEEGGA